MGTGHSLKLDLQGSKLTTEETKELHGLLEEVSELVGRTSKV